MRLMFAAVLTCAFAAHAQNALRQAQSLVNDATNQLRRLPPPCGSLAPRLTAMSQELAGLSGQVDAWDVQQVSRRLSELAATAGFANCPDRVVQRLLQAEDALDDLRVHRWQRPGGPRAVDEQRNRFAQLSAVKVQTNVATPDGERAVRLTVPRLTLNNMRNQRFSLATRFRSLQGNWSEWTATQQWVVPSDPYVWNNALTHLLRYSTLAEEDFAQGRFLAQVAAFDAQGRQVVSRDVTFTVKLPRLQPRPGTYPPGAPPQQMPPGTYPPPMPPPLDGPPGAQPYPLARDCGTGSDDLGCSISRNGRWPMDGATWASVYAAMRSQPNEIYRRDTVTSMLSQQVLTAAQLGLVLDLFNNEIYRYEVAQFCAPRVSNPLQAVGFSNKFNNAIYQRDFVTLMSNQR